jgi:hypothetical protein
MALKLAKSANEGKTLFCLKILNMGIINAKLYASLISIEKVS